MPRPAAKNNNNKKKTMRPRPLSPKKAGAAGEAKLFSWNSVEREELNPLLQRQMIVGKDVMVARMALKKGCVVPLHHHSNEQVSCMLEGSLKFSIEGKDIVLRAGEVLAIPPHVPHAAEAVEDCVALDVFHPPRKDWIKGTDKYLRGGK